MHPYVRRKLIFHVVCFSQLYPAIDAERDRRLVLCMLVHTYRYWFCTHIQILGEMETQKLLVNATFVTLDENDRVCEALGAYH